MSDALQHLPRTGHAAQVGCSDVKARILRTQSDTAAIRGSTTIRELMERFSDGGALDLMARLGWPCGHCSARSTEPLSLAAKRHGNPVRAVIECFRMLDSGGPSETALDAARARPRRSPDPSRAWLRSAARYPRGGVRS